MKKYSVLSLSFIIVVLCFAQPIQKVRIASVKINPNYSTSIGNRVKTFSIEVDLNNETNIPVYFWTWNNRWFRNFIFSRKDIFFNNFISDAPFCCLLLPYLNIKYIGRFYFQNETDQYSIENLSVAFKFYDALKYTEKEYLEIDYLIDEKGKSEKTIRINADTIRYYRPIKVMYQIWL